MNGNANEWLSLGIIDLFVTHKPQKQVNKTSYKYFIRILQSLKQSKSIALADFPVNGHYSVFSV